MSIYEPVTGQDIFIIIFLNLFLNRNGKRRGLSSQENTGHKRAFSLPGRGEKKEGAGGKSGRDTGGRSQGFPDTAVQDTLGSPGWVGFKI